jgi:dipeptidase D
LTQIPRGSGNEVHASDWVANFARERGLEAVQDDMHTILVKKPGQGGLENAPPLILHGHLDMVCEKDEGVDINFETDPIPVMIDGEFVTADGTSLGADNGIGVSYILALLDSKDLPHPPLEAVLTAMEEKGKVGASKFDGSQLSGKRMIDFNWITDTEILAGCSGDVTFQVDIPAEWEPVPQTHTESRLLKVRGLVGGHCEFDIHLERANAILVLARVLNRILSEYDVRIANPHGGAQNNAIPMDADVVLALRPEHREGIEQTLQDLQKTLRTEYDLADPAIRLELDDAPAPERVFSADATARFARLTGLIPNGVISWSLKVKGIVESSNNLGTVRTTDDGALPDVDDHGRGHVPEARGLRPGRSLAGLAGGGVTCGTVRARRAGIPRTTPTRSCSRSPSRRTATSSVRSRTSTSRSAAWNWACSAVTFRDWTPSRSVRNCTTCTPLRRQCGTPPSPRCGHWFARSSAGSGNLALVRPGTDLPWPGGRCPAFL